MSSVTLHPSVSAEQLLQALIKYSSEVCCRQVFVGGSDDYDARWAMIGKVFSIVVV